MTDHEWPDPDFEPEYPDGGADTADLSQPFDGLDLPDDTPDDPPDVAEPDVPDAAAYSLDEAAYDADDSFEDDFDDDTGAPGDGGGDPPVGADPDLDPAADHDSQPVFPPALDLDPPPEPVDGYPWADPTTLGEAPLADPVAANNAAPDPNDLASYAAEDIPAGADPWTALTASEDPATSSLARWWSQTP
ncbi:hypothetical protein [Micromonospora sp. CPCC 206061]|uniref:hypothetical protein n=1 Tax=Micromonospora sp. CPCC 206061 TaxID=3122410 RepID=UPI002FEEEF8A